MKSRRKILCRAKGKNESSRSEHYPATQPSLEKGKKVQVKWAFRRQRARSPGIDTWANSILVATIPSSVCMHSAVLSTYGTSSDGETFFADINGVGSANEQWASIVSGLVALLNNQLVAGLETVVLTKGWNRPSPVPANTPLSMGRLS